MVKHKIASSGSAGTLCQKMPRISAVTDRLRHKKVRRSLVLGSELEQVRSQLKSANKTITRLQTQHKSELEELRVLLVSLDS
jgi:hypothetical protein